MPHHEKRYYWCLPLLFNFWTVFLQHCMADGKAEVAVPRVRSHPENEKIDIWSSPISSHSTVLYHVYPKSSFLDTLLPFSTHQVTLSQSYNPDDPSFEVENVMEMPTSSRFTTNVIGVHEFSIGTSSDIKNSWLINDRDEEQTSFSRVERQASFNHLDNFRFSSTLSTTWALRTIICLSCKKTSTLNPRTIVGSKQEVSSPVLRNNLYGSIEFSGSDSLGFNSETKYEIQPSSKLAHLPDVSPVFSNVLSFKISELPIVTFNISPSPVDVGLLKTVEISSSDIVNLYTFSLRNETFQFSSIGSSTFVDLSPRLPHLTSCMSDEDIEEKRPTFRIDEESTLFTSSKKINEFTKDIFLMSHHSDSVFSYSSTIYSSEMSPNSDIISEESHIFHTEQIPDNLVEISSDIIWRATYSRSLISDEDEDYVLSPEQSSKRLAFSNHLPIHFAEIFATRNIEVNSEKTKFPKQMTSFIPSNDFFNNLHVWSNAAFTQQTISVSLSELENHKLNVSLSGLENHKLNVSLSGLENHKLNVSLSELENHKLNISLSGLENHKLNVSLSELENHKLNVSLSELENHKLNISLSGLENHKLNVSLSGLENHKLNVSLSGLENHTYVSSQTFTSFGTDELTVSSLFLLQHNSTIHPDIPLENNTINHFNVLVGYNTTSRSKISMQHNTIIQSNIPRQHNTTILSNVLIQHDSSIIPNYSVQYNNKTYLNITKQPNTTTELNVPAHISSQIDAAIEPDIPMHVNTTAKIYFPTESDNLTELDIPTEHNTIRGSDVSTEHDVSMGLDNLNLIASDVSPETVNPKGLLVPIQPDNPTGFNNVTVSGIVMQLDDSKDLDKLIDHDTVAHFDNPTKPDVATQPDNPTDFDVPTRPDSPTELDNVTVSNISTQFDIQIKYDSALESNLPVEPRTSVAFHIPTFVDNSKEPSIPTYPDIQANLVDPRQVDPVDVHKLNDSPESHTFKAYDPNDTIEDSYSIPNLLPNEQFVSKTANKYFLEDENENKIEDYGINPHLLISPVVALKPTKVYRDFREIPPRSLELSSSSDPDLRSYILERSLTITSKFNLKSFISTDATPNFIWNKQSSKVVPLRASLYVPDDIQSQRNGETSSSGNLKQYKTSNRQTGILIPTIFQTTYALKRTDIPWHSTQTFEVYSTRNEKKIVHETTSVEETPLSSSKFHVFEETTTMWDMDKTTIYPSSETEVYSHVPFIPFYISLAMLMSWVRFCIVKETLRREIAWMLTSALNQPILPGQVCFKNAQEQCEAVIHQNDKEILTKSKSIDVFVYMNDKDGKYDLILTRRSAQVLREEAGKSKTLVYHNSVHRVDTYFQESHLRRPTRHTTSGMIATVTISCIGGACLLLLCILLMVMKQRLRQPRNCSPSHDTYSLESFSTISSFQRRRGGRSSLCSFVNQAFQDPDVLSHPLNTSSLAVFTSNIEAINHEFKIIPMNMPRVDEAPPGTEVKNRYANVIPVPETRVFLTPRPGEPHSDYINANYVRPRCAPYFPSKLTDCDRSYGQYQVSLKKKEIDENYTISMFRLRRTDLNEFRDVTHFWYTNWPVHGVPNEVYKVINFLLEARVYMDSSSSPTIVHCSPGTGRTGVIMALDSCIRQYEESQTVDVVRSVYRLRQDRGGAVQSKEQYVFIYEALREYVCNILHEPYNSTIVCSS
ncbi:uncharacterized protein LOC106463795 isoform X2 [Limulus polyphemus]|uniref:protein-tyrosine-phosphatase n=1 Tax=Limulus polyphemus TaxID=6850 RepID=A0ABM1STZ6_LIMPO|nr:uncharacterized protein LOC106463795 isoform X2 [Limulus polyphemus]